MNVDMIITADPTGEQLVKFAEDTAKTLVHNGLTRSQIRNIFTEVRKIEAQWEQDASSHDEALRRLNMLKPKMDYQVARSAPVGVLRDVLKSAIEAVNQAKDPVERSRRFQRFMDLFEAILAYHRANGGKN